MTSSMLWGHQYHVKCLTVLGCVRLSSSVRDDVLHVKGAVILVDLAEGFGPLCPHQMCLRCEGGKAEQVAHNGKAEWSWNPAIALQIFCKWN